MCVCVCVLCFFTKFVVYRQGVCAKAFTDDLSLWGNSFWVTGNRTCINPKFRSQSPAVITGLSQAINFTLMCSPRNNTNFGESLLFLVICRFVLMKIIAVADKCMCACVRVCVCVCVVFFSPSCCVPAGGVCKGFHR